MMLIIIIKFYKFNDDEIFNITLTFNVNLTAVITLNYKLIN